MKRRALLLGVLIGCGQTQGSSSAPGTGSADDTDGIGTAGQRTVCTNCARRGVAGGESSDFGGLDAACTGDPAPLPDDELLLARLDAARAVYAGSFESSLRWAYNTREQPPGPGTFWSALPSGYADTTPLTAHVVLGESRYLVGRPAPSSDISDCPNFFFTPATVELAAADGAVAGVAYGGFRFGDSFDGALYANAELGDLVGSLDFHLDPTLHYRGLLSLELHAYPEGKRGRLSVEVHTPVQAERAGIYLPLSASFPDDGCASSGFPSSADAPLDWLGGQTAAQLLATWSTLLQQLPIHGVRHDCSDDSRDGTPVELAFAVGVPDLDICQLPLSVAEPATRGSISFHGPIRFGTSDGLIDAPLVAGSADSISLYLRSTDLDEPIPADQFASQSGITGVDTQGSPELSYLVSADFSRVGDQVSASGALLVKGHDCQNGQCFLEARADVLWPADDPSTTSFCPWR